ncbi:MAG: hypothetical protein GY888_04135, partial [Planctomycetaceae bacterium]|nr:hypothetical protein [Planctomycetaceae bacterium]
MDFWHRPGWTNTARLRPSDGTAGDHFGWSVSVSGQTAIVGAPLHQDEQGAVYIYQENSTPDMLWNIGTSWAQVDKLMVTEATRFGSSVAISGDTVVVGAPETNSVYVFRNLDGTWTEVATLRPADPQDAAQFGYSMAISDNTLVVGAPGYRANGDPVGAAYVFQRVNGLWTETARLTGSDATSDDELGQFVGISNDRILVGGNQEPYLFENHTGNWQETTQLPNFARDAQSGF